jgi:hypothetical protein
MGNKKNIVGKASPLTLSLTPGMYAYLEELSMTNAYGKSAADTAETILLNELRRMLFAGELETLRSKMPGVPTEGNEDDDKE